MDQILATLQTLTKDELNIIKTEATSQIHINEYFEDIEHDEALTPELMKLVTDGVITVVQVTEDEDAHHHDCVQRDLCSEEGVCMNIKLRIKDIQDVVELRYITHSSKHTFTEHRRIKLDGKIYEFGIGDETDDMSEYDTDHERGVFPAEYIYVLRKLHTIFNIDYDQTAAMIHLLFGCWSHYPYIKDNIQSLEKLIQMWE